MKIGIPVVNKSLAENVFKEFGQCPVYIIYDTDNKSSRYIYSYLRYDNNKGGPVAAQIFADGKIDVVITGDIDTRSLSILNNAGIKVFDGFPAFGKQAMDRLMENKLELIIDKNIAKNINDLKRFLFYDFELTFEGKKRLYEDWDFILKLKPKQKIPENWLSPIDYSRGSYQLKLEIQKMRRVGKPVEFEICWCNFPEDKDSDIPHRCSYGHYCSFSSPGSYEHIACLDDMELTTIDGNIKKWDWKNAWDSPFVLVKPYSQDPFPIKFKIQVTIFESIL